MTRTGGGKDQRLTIDQPLRDAAEIVAPDDSVRRGADGDKLTVNTRKMDNHITSIGAAKDKPRLSLIRQPHIGVDGYAGAAENIDNAEKFGQFFIGPALNLARLLESENRCHDILYVHFP